MKSGASKMTTVITAIIFSSKRLYGRSRPMLAQQVTFRNGRSDD